MNIKPLMKQAQQMQDQMQRQMATIRAEGSAGGGMVKSEMSGNKELLSISIDKDAVDPEDIEMLQNPLAPTVNRRKICTMSADLYNKIFALPRSESGPLLRYLLAQ